MNITGTIMVTGEHGTGKTSFSLEACDPSRTIFIDDDLKGRASINQIRADDIEFGRYIDFIEETKGMRRLDIHKKGKLLIESITPGEFDCAIWDTWTRFEETCHSYVQAYPDEFRQPDGWAAMGKIRSGEEYKEARSYEARLIAELQRKVPLVILVSHLKNHYANNVQTGKQIPAVSPAVLRVCSLRLWIRHNPAGGTPIGLVLKNIDRKVLENGRLRTLQILPKKITPLETEHSLWESIERYYNDPVGLRKPVANEIPDDFEMSLIDGTLTEDQRLSWLYALKTQKEEEQEEELLVRENIRETWETGEYESKKDLADYLGVPLKEVLAALREGE
jgi:hypothetical protein